MVPLTVAQREYIITHDALLGHAETARRCGCSEAAVRKIMKAHMEENPDAHNHAEERGPLTRLEELKRLRATLTRSLDEAPPQAVASLARELRATMEEIERLEGGDDDEASKALAAIAESIAKRMPS